ncbi:hypothetical protein RF11_08841 [Thelohanellus kitauei]|uniref:Rapamycin-insensitive companion of mTOR middle domain-containing protein n=1 Tax=Thelohanellus kitauei TaxID=669202 RepID=A0A0C2MJE5_THEKT|nr:hypothetical protein RF11_08841 [Thelohanellus kitauei]
MIDKSQESITYKYTSLMDRFMSALRDFLIPSRSNFCFTKSSHPIAKYASEVAFLFFKTILHPDQSNDGLNMVNQFLLSLHAIIDKDSIVPRNNIKFSEFYNSMQDCLSVQYFALIGFIQEFSIGQMLIEGSHILTKIYNVLESTELFPFIKAVIPHMNYNNPVCQKFIGAIISKDNSENKLYVLRFLRWYSRQDQNKDFVLLYLTRMLHDLNQSVREEATDVLDEILDCDITACEDVIALNIPYLFLGTIGVKLLSRLATTLPSRSDSFKKLTKFFPYLIEEWCSVRFDLSQNFLVRYCENIETRLNCSLGRPVPDKDSGTLNPFKLGFECHINTYKLHKFINLSKCEHMLNIHLKSDVDYFQIRSKILFIANYASTSKGLKAIEKMDNNILQKIVKLVYHSDQLSLRWFVVN